MASKVPPVPPDNRSHKGVGDTKAAPVGQTPHRRSRVRNPDQQGQQANTKQNTTHQGYQQDR